MSRRESLPDVVTADTGRREFLSALAGASAVVGGAKAVDNVLIGYGTVTGTNLVAQAEAGELAAIVNDGFGPRPSSVAVGEYRIDVQPRAEAVRVGGPAAETRFPTTAQGAEAAAAFDDANNLGGLLADLVRDLADLTAGRQSFEFYDVAGFFDRVENAEPRAIATGAVRGWPGADAEVVARFSDADPRDPAATLKGLIAGFREHTSYDTARYLAGSIQDNVLFGTVDLRSHFRTSVSFPALLSGEQEGLFCYEFTDRSLEALHAVPAHEQTVPVVGGRIWDKRHKHVYTAVASLIRDPDLRIPMTFVDYTHTTLYDDLNLRGLLGEGFEAFNERHRATVSHWRP